MLRRREFLCTGALLYGAGAGTARGADDGSAAFDADSVPRALQALGLPDALPPATGVLTLQALDLVEDGATVEVGVGTSITGRQRWLLLVEKNPNPLAADFLLSERIAPALTLRLKVAQSGELQAIAQPADGPAASARRRIEVTIGGCGEGEIATDLPQVAEPPQPTRMRVRRDGADADVRLLMSHRMETGLRRDAAGRPVPAWYIRDATVTLNGEAVLRARWGTSISRNPYLRFKLLGTAAGDRLGVAWTDNRGARRSDETALA